MLVENVEMEQLEFRIRKPEDNRPWKKIPVTKRITVFYVAGDDVVARREIIGRGVTRMLCQRYNSVEARWNVKHCQQGHYLVGQSCGGQ